MGSRAVSAAACLQGLFWGCPGVCVSAAWGAEIVPWARVSEAPSLTPPTPSRF